MSQSVSFSDLGGLLGLSGTGTESANLQQVFDTLGLEGKTFADLLDTEFAQLLDPELLEQGLNLEELSPEAEDSLLPLLALMGGKNLPQEGENEQPGSLALLTDGGKKNLEQALKAIESRLSGQSSELEAGKPVLLNSSTDGKDISEEFLQQLQLSANKVMQASSSVSQSVTQLGAVQPNNPQTLMQSQLSPVPVTQTVQTPPGQPGWDVQVGQRLIWMVGNEIKSAAIKLNPAELGPMEVKVRTEGEKVQISIQVQNAPVREAIEQSLPRLREALNGQGMDLLNVNVSQQGFSQHEQRGEQAETHDRFLDSGMDGADSTEATDVKVTTSQGLVDYYI